jgi:hypothetical protein
VHNLGDEINARGFEDAFRVEVEGKSAGFVIMMSRSKGSLD